MDNIEYSEADVRYFNKVISLSISYNTPPKKIEEMLKQKLEDKKSSFICGDIVSLKDAPESRYIIEEINHNEIIMLGMRRKGKHRVVRDDSEITLCEKDLILYSRDEGNGLLYG